MVAHSTSAVNRENLLFMPGIYNETLKLLLMAHDYFYHNGHQDQSRLNARDRTLYASEMSRITMRLSCIMAWLLTRKALLSGKISLEDALSKYRLDCRDVCLVNNSDIIHIMPKFMSNLMVSTLELYERVSRLDDQIGEEPEESNETWQ